ncbi:MAG: hypothetical protein RMA76_15325 [Deltaproteobacteria bacterium]|jgi:hypothetical protein
MKVGQRTLRLSTIALVLAAVGACREAAEAPVPVAAPAVAAVAGPTYSPFVVRMTSELPFDVISFKDVGMSVDPSTRQLVYEEVAESLSLELASHPELPMTSAVQYSSEMADAAHHLACGEDHIYVDLWTPADLERWGYSLWSGCSEADRFAHKEIERADVADIDALTREIAASLRQAVTKKCFVAKC